MFHQILAMTVKEIKVLLHNRGAITGLFLLPMAFILVMTLALQGVFSSGSSSNPVHLLVANGDSGPVAAKVVADLRGLDGLVVVDQVAGQPLTRAEAESLILSHKYQLALVFPADFSARVLAAGAGSGSAGATVSFVVDPTVGEQLLSPVRGMVQGFTDREAALAQAPEKTRASFDRLASGLPASQAPLVQAIGSKFADQLNSGELPSASSGVRYAVTSPAGFKAEKEPSSAEQNVPGYTIYGVFFIIGTIATSFFRERNEGTFRRLQAAPISKVALMIGKLLPYYLINLVQIGLMFATGVLLFHISLGSDPLALLLVALSTSAAATGMGFLLASLGRSEEQVSSLGTLISVVMAAVGGMMVPVYVMPRFMQTVSQFTPHAWALAGFQDVMVRGLGVQAVLPAVGMLLGFAVLFWGIGVWRFRFDLSA